MFGFLEWMFLNLLLVLLWLLELYEFVDGFGVGVIEVVEGVMFCMLMLCSYWRFVKLLFNEVCFFFWFMGFWVF